MMSNDHENQFLDDIKEIFGSLENYLLQMEPESHDEALQSSIFRDLHTIKGSLYMFDRKDLGDLAHNLENAYEVLNNAKVAFPKVLINISLQIVDAFRLYVDESSLPSKEAIDEIADLNEELNEFLKDISASENISAAPIEVYPYLTLLTAKAEVDIAAEDGHPVHFILRDMLEDVSHIEKVITRGTGSIKEWRILLISEVTEEALQAQFIFVEDEIKTEISSFLLPLESENSIDLSLFEAKLGADNLNPLLEELANFAIMLSRSFPQEKKTEDQKKRNRTSESDFIKVGRGKMEELMNWVSELVTMQATLQNEAELHNSERLRNLADSMDLITENLRDTIFSVSLVPLKTLESRFNRLVRDLSESLNKQVILESEGFETELDKKIIANLTDPLLHIIRNSIDHGIESPAERLAANKPAEGIITLKSYYEGNAVVIEISDDGKGVDINKLRAKAIKHNLLSEQDEPREHELLQLIFHPGLSTSNQVSDVSGRGVGMDVVKRKINEVRGTVHVSSKAGEGTNIVIKIPLSLSIMDGLLTKVGTTNFVLPLNSIREIHRFPKEYFYDRPSQSELLEIEGNQVPVLSLEKRFHLPAGTSKTVDVINVDVGASKTGIAVDEIKGQIKAVLKPIGEQYADQEFISGATILGNGEMAFVLDLDKVLN